MADTDAECDPFTMDPASDTDAEYDPFTTLPLCEELLVFEVGKAAWYISRWLIQQKCKIDISVNSPNTINDSAVGAYSEPALTKTIAPPRDATLKVGGAADYFREQLIKRRRIMNTIVNSPGTIKTTADGAYSEPSLVKEPPPPFKAPPPRNRLG